MGYGANQAAAGSRSENTDKGYTSLRDNGQTNTHFAQQTAETEDDQPELERQNDREYHTSKPDEEFEAQAGNLENRLSAHPERSIDRAGVPHDRSKDVGIGQGEFEPFDAGKTILRVSPEHDLGFDQDNNVDPPAVLQLAGIGRHGSVYYRAPPRGRSSEAARRRNGPFEQSPLAPRTQNSSKIQGQVADRVYDDGQIPASNTSRQPKGSLEQDKLDRNAHAQQSSPATRHTSVATGEHSQAPIRPFQDSMGMVSRGQIPQKESEFPTPGATKYQPGEPPAGGMKKVPPQLRATQTEPRSDDPQSLPRGPSNSPRTETVKRQGFEPGNAPQAQETPNKRYSEPNSPQQSLQVGAKWTPVSPPGSQHASQQTIPPRQGITGLPSAFHLASQPDLSPQGSQIKASMAGLLQNRENPQAGPLGYSPSVKPMKSAPKEPAGTIYEQQVELGSSKDQMGNKEPELKPSDMVPKRAPSADVHLTAEALIGQIVRGEQLPLSDLTKPKASLALSEGTYS